MIALGAAVLLLAVLSAWLGWRVRRLRAATLALLGEKLGRYDRTLSQCDALLEEVLQCSARQGADPISRVNAIERVKPFREKLNREWAQLRLHRIRAERGLD